MTNRKEKTYILSIFFNIFLFFVSAAGFYITYKRGSDFVAHIIYAQNFKQGKICEATTYPIWHMLFLFFDLCLHFLKGICSRSGIVYDGLLAALTTSVFFLAAYNVTKHYLDRALQSRSKEFRSGAILAASLMFVGPLYIPWINRLYYPGQGILTTWHNPTMMAVKFLSIICFFQCYEIYSHHAETGWKPILIFSVTLLASAFFKPSFYQMFVPGLALFCGVELLCSKGKRIGWCLKMAVSVLPVCLMVFLQGSILFGGEKNTGIVIAIGRTAGEFTDHPLLSTLLLICFPAFVLVTACIKKYWDKRLLFAWCLFVSGWGQYICLCMTGVNWWAGNFAWGYYLAANLLFIVSLIALWSMGREKVIKKPVLIIGWVIYGIQFAFGVLYYFNLFRPGKTYMDPLDFSFLQYFFR